jgi:histidine triad (HIT) family protein
MDCIFCKIIRGEVEAGKLYEDDNVLAFLDANPITKGHSLVVTKQHFENIFDIDAEILKDVITTGKKVTDMLQKSLGASGANLINSSGKDAEQIIFHFHLHLVPRYENDLLNMHEWWHIKERKITIDEQKSLAERIKNNN